MPSKITTDTIRRKAIIDSWRPNTSAPPVPLTAADALLVKANRAFGYDPELINNSGDDPFNGLYDWLARNRWNVYPVPSPNDITTDATAGYDWTSDIKHVLRDEVAGMPVKRIVIEINPYTVWTGSGSYVADRTSCRPALDLTTKSLLDAAGDWTVDLAHLGNIYHNLVLDNTYTSTSAVANPGATQCPLLPGAADAPIPTLIMATPSDISITRFLQYAKSLGYDVGIRIDPVFLDLTGDSPDRCIIDRRVIGESGEPWANLAQFQRWMYEFRAMVTHYALISVFAGVVPFYFGIGSEMRGCTHNTNIQIREWAVSSFQLAAHEVHDILGPNCLATYAPDSSEYHAFVVNATTERYFPVDQLGSDPMNEYYALEWGQPIADGDEQSPCELAEGVFRGQNTDYRYDKSAGDPNYSADHRYLVDSTDPSDGCGLEGCLPLHPGLTPIPLDSGYAIKNLPAFVEGAHYVSAADIVISDPAPPASGTLVALVSPAAGNRIQTSGGLDLGGVTLSNLKGYDALGVSSLAINTTDLDTIYPAPVGFGVRTPPWEILKFLPLNTAGDYNASTADHGIYYSFMMPTYARQWRVSGTGNAPTDSVNYVRNLEPETSTNKQPQFWPFEDSENNAELNWYVAGQHRYKQSWVFECVVKIDNIEHDDEARRYIMFTKGTTGQSNEGGTQPGSPFAWIAVHKLPREDFHHFEFAAKHQVGGSGTDPYDLWSGLTVKDVEQFDTNSPKPLSTNRIVYGHVYRVQMYLNQTPHAPHNVPFVECRVWDVSDGGKLIFNQALGTPGFNTYWIAPMAGAQVFVGAGLDTVDTPDLRGFLPGRLYYVGMWEHDESAWGGHYWLDDTYAGADTIRTSWIPAMKSMAITRLGYQSLAGMQAEPDTDVSLFADDGSEPEFTRDFPDFSWWHRYRARYNNANVYDIGGPYGAKFTADERIQALSLAITVQQFHNAQVRRLDGTKMAAIAEVILDRFEAHPAPVNYAPDPSGAGLALPDQLKYRLSRAGNNKLWARIARANASGSNQAPPPLGGASTSVTPYPTENAGAASDGVKSGSKGTTGGIVTAIRYLVTDYGAVGDGLQSSAPLNDVAFELCSDDASLTGGTVYIPEGEYFVSASLTPNSNQHWELHHGATLSIVDNADVPVIHIGHANIKITGGTINGNRAGGNTGSLARGIFIDSLDTLIYDVEILECGSQAIRASAGGDNLRVTGCYIHDCENSGIEAVSVSTGIIADNVMKDIGEGPGGFSILLAGVTDYTITGNVMNGGNGGVVFNGNRGTIVGNMFHDQIEEGVAVDGGNECTVSGNTFTNVGSSPAPTINVINGSQNVTVADNTILDAQSSGISIGSAVDTVSHVAITGNVIRNADLAGILIVSAGDCTVVGNVMSGIAGKGIAWAGGGRGTIGDNRIEGCTVAGIEISFQSYITITGNVLFDLGTSDPNTTQGIVLDTSSFCTIVGNIITDSRTLTERINTGIAFVGGSGACIVTDNIINNAQTAMSLVTTTNVLSGNSTAGTRQHILTQFVPPTNNTEDIALTGTRYKTAFLVNLDVSTGVTLPNSSITNAMLAGSITPSKLLDYVNATFTPELRGDGGGSTHAHTYVTQQGWYTRIGPLVIYTFTILLSAKDAGLAGNVYVTLPVASLNQTNVNWHAAVGGVSNVDLAAGKTQYYWVVVPNTTRLLMAQIGDNVALATITAAAIGNTSQVGGTIAYLVA